MTRRERILLALSSTSAVLLLYLVFQVWTMTEMPGKSFRGELPAADAALKELAAELREGVAVLSQEIGERNVSRHPRDWIAPPNGSKTSLTLADFLGRQIYTVDGHACVNLGVAIPGKTRPAEIVLVGTRSNSVIGTPGANDNGTGIAAVLAMLRHFKNRPLDRTLRFAAFVNEEPPYFKPSRWARSIYAKQCRAAKRENRGDGSAWKPSAITSDAPGSRHYPRPFGLLYPSVGQFHRLRGQQGVGRTGAAGDRHLPRERTISSEGGRLPDFVPGVGFSDHWSFNQQGYAAIMVTDTAMFRYPHYHEAEDTIDKIDFDRTARVVRGLEKVIEELGK